MSSYPHSFPLRLTTDLSNTLHSASLSTGITKSDLIRVALNKFLVELSQSGITEAAGSRYFCERFFRASCSKNQQKTTRPPMPSAAPTRPRHLVSTQQGVET